MIFMGLIRDLSRERAKEGGNIIISPKMFFVARRCRVEYRKNANHLRHPQALYSYSFRR